MSANAATEALAAWGGGTLLRLVAERENAVYQALLDSGAHVALRLHRTGYRSADAVADELRWACAFAAEGIACPAPVRARDGAWVADVTDGRLASVVGWVAGAAIVPGAATLRALGRELARLHSAADRLCAAGRDPGLRRFPRWDAAALLGDNPAWGRFWENPTLSEAEAARLDAARSHLRDTLAARDNLDVGFIHADLLPDNVLDAGARLVLIDFDDCGVGYRAYDLATALISLTTRADFETLRTALLAGYLEARELGPDQQRDLEWQVALFTAIRALASCGWAASRAGPEDPRCRAYAERALRLANPWVAAGPAG